MKAVILFLALFFVFAVNLSGQSRCLTDEEAKKVIESIQSTKPVSENKNLRKELLSMQEEREKLNEKISENIEKNIDLIPQANMMGERHLLRVCQIIKESGWLTNKIIGDDGFKAFTFLITYNKAYQFQRELLPVLVEAAKKGYVGNPFLAQMVDNIRLSNRLPQIFGTSATVRNNVVYLYPLLNQEKVDEWRRVYDLPPLVAQIKELENRFFMPVLIMQRPSLPPNLIQRKNDKNSDTTILGISDDDTEILKVDTKLVNLNVRILTPDSKPVGDLNLSKQDFTVLEDDAEQEIVFFSTTEHPFDLVLLLDFSGSTVGKRGLIKKAAKRFVEYARPTDRIAVVAFASEIELVCGLTTDKKALFKKIDHIDIEGGSAIWDSLKFTYENIIKKESVGRRNAVVFMTDGEDSSLKTSFANLMETVRNNDTTVFPVYINSPYPGWTKKLRRKGFQSLWLLAEESGGQLYEVDDAKDLNGIYEQIINDLGKVYSIGYEPKNEIRDGGWRNLSVKIKTQPDFVIRTRRGYYAK